MILILKEDTDKNGDEYRQLVEFLANLKNVESRVHHEKGAEKTLTEIYLVGDTSSLEI